MLRQTINGQRVDLAETTAVLMRVARLWKRNAQGKLRRDDRNATGTLTGSMNITMGVSRSGPWVDLTPGVDYWIFVDSGVRGAVESKWPGQGVNDEGRPFQYREKRPPVDAILAWLKVRGVANRDERGRFRKGGQRALAFAIAESIRRRGLKPSRFITATGSRIEVKYAGEIAEAYMNDIAEALLKPKKK